MIRNTDFQDDIFKCIFVNKGVKIYIKNSLQCVPRGATDIIPALVQILAWRRPGHKPLFEPYDGYFTEAYMRHSASVS